MQRLTKRQILRFFRFLFATTALTLIGLFTGYSIVLMPIYIPLSIIGLAAVILLWTIPELDTNIDKITKFFLFLHIFVNSVVPYYYTFVVPGVGWVNIRRVVLLTVSVSVMLTLASSKQSRASVIGRLRSTPLLGYAAILFFVIQLFSTFTAIHPADALRGFLNLCISWYIPFLGILAVARSDDTASFIRLFVVCLIINFIIGGVEFYLGHPYLLMAVPASIRAQLIADNPRLASLMMIDYRQGLYRARSTFTSGLSWGEFAAMSAPFAAYFLVNREKRFDLMLGIVGAIAALLSVFGGGSRGGYLGLFSSIGCFFFVWALARNKHRPESMFGGFFLIFYAMGGAAFIGAIFFVGKLHRLVLGGGELQSSNDGRSTQWTLAIPKIIARPILGYGEGSPGEVVGFYPSGSLPTVDSYLITLLVSYGIPGFLAFVVTILGAIVICLARKIKHAGPDSNQALALGCSLIAFAAYRPFLSQTDNHGYLLIILAVTFVALQASIKVPERARAQTKIAPRPIGPLQPYAGTAHGFHRQG